MGTRQGPCELALGPPKGQREEEHGDGDQGWRTHVQAALGEMRAGRTRPHLWGQEEAPAGDMRMRDGGPFLDAGANSGDNCVRKRVAIIGWR